MKRSYRDLADSLANGGWQHDCDDPPNARRDDIQIAALIDIMQSLRVIRTLLQCPNISSGLQSMRKLEALAREFWVKPTRRKGAKK